MKTKTHHVLAKRVNQYTTDVVYQCGPYFYFGKKNGGREGAFQPNSPNDSWEFWHEGPDEIDQERALAKCAELGVDEVELAWK